VPYGPLEEEQACKYLRTLSERICAAFEELHRFGYAHSDVRLPNVGFNVNCDAVLIDMERCTPVDEQSPFCLQLGMQSCMYRKPETMQGVFTAKRMDYVQLGWLLVWMLNCTGDYHKSGFLGVTKNMIMMFVVVQIVLWWDYSHANQSTGSQVII